MFVTYEAYEADKESKKMKNNNRKIKTLVRKNWLILEEKWNIKNIYLEKYPNNYIFKNCKNFNILKNNNSILILEIYDKENKKNILVFDKIKWVNKENKKKLNSVIENWKWKKDTIIEKIEIDIIYKIYSDKNIKKMNSTYIEWENNTISSSIWNYETEEDKKIYKKYFKKWIKEILLNLLK